MAAFGKLKLIRSSINRSYKISRGLPFQKAPCSCVLADKIYRNRENRRYCKERGIRLSGPALGRPKKGEERNKVQDYRDECERVEVERKFSLGKRKCGMGLVTVKPEDTAAHVVALSILLLNLRKIQYAFLQFLNWLLGFLQPCEKLRVVQ